MRCTKCSFISFDDLMACAKCANDLSRLSQELNGTCIETRQEFFLGSAIQSGGLEEDNFSDSQMLPPIDHGDMNFDDTSTGGFSPLASSQTPSGLNFDDSVGVAAEDDIAIELGDIMPIDFEQLDSASAASAGAMERTDALSLDDFSFDLDKSGGVSTPAEKDIDLELNSDLDDANFDFNFNDELSGVDAGDSSRGLSSVSGDVTAAAFDSTLDDVTDALHANAGFDLDQELFDQLADVSGGFDETISLGQDASFDDTKIAPLAIGDGGAASLELDESLVAELAGDSALDGSGEFPMDFSADSSASGDFELDPALVAELASGEDGAGVSGEVSSAVAEKFSPEDTSVFDDSLELSFTPTAEKVSSSVPFEDLTGEFPSIREEDDTVLSGLDLADIDVSDLVDTSGEMADADENSVFVTQESRPEVLDPFMSDAHAGEDTIQELASGESVSSDLQADDSLELKLDGVVLVDDESGVDPVDAVSGAESGGDGLVAEALSDGLPELELEDDLALERLDDSGALLAADIDTLALDADFEAFLSKTASVEKLPEIELIPDDDDDLPPELPS